MVGSQACGLKGESEWKVSEVIYLTRHDDWHAMTNRLQVAGVQLVRPRIEYNPNSTDDDVLSQLSAANPALK